jgi:hypothetical protein
METSATPLSPRLEALLRQPAVMIASAQALDGRSAIARVMGARRRDDGGLDLMIAAHQWPEAVAGLVEGGPLALTVCRPCDYETYQMKGPARPPAPADAADLAFAADYIAAISAELRRLGVAERQIACWRTLEGLVRIGFTPIEQFAQTPGPGAGRAIKPAAGAGQ